METPILIKLIDRVTKKVPQKGLYKCFCGKEFITSVWAVNNGRTKSCSCYQKQKASALRKTHNDSNNRLYKLFKNIKTRCTNPKNRYFHKGISLCEEWKNSYILFKECIF